MTPSEHLHTGAESAAELLARRAQLQDWLARLNEVGTNIPGQVARRVREDYEQRLAAVVAELSAHSEALGADRERLEDKLLAAAERHDGAVDALEEARLRHLIGELSIDDWENRRPGLESDVEAAATERAETEREIAALDDLFRQISGPTVDDEVTVEAGTPAPESVATEEEEEEPSAASGSFAEAAEEWDPDLPMLEETREPEAVAPEAAEPPHMAVQRSEATPTQESKPFDEDLVEITNFAAEAEALANQVDREPANDDYAFLEELDRAIAATAREEEGEPAGETRPQPGLKCPECGYSNDPAAWYCGVCGVDLG